MPFEVLDGGKGKEPDPEVIAILAELRQIDGRGSRVGEGLRGSGLDAILELRAEVGAEAAHQYLVGLAAKLAAKHGWEGKEKHVETALGIFFFSPG